MQDHETQANGHAATAVRQAVALRELIAQSFGIHRDEVTQDLAYQSIPEWDSFAHVKLMLNIESHLGIKIDDQALVSLRTVRAIEEFVGAHSGLGAPENIQMMVIEPKVGVHRGLEGIAFDRSGISNIDGQAGRLEYHGYSIGELAQRSSFEEVSLLLLRGEMPSFELLMEFCQQLSDSRLIDDGSHSFISRLQHLSAIDAVRTCVSAMKHEGEEWVDFLQLGIRIISAIPVLTAIHCAQCNGASVPQPDASLSHAGNVSWMLAGEREESKIADLDQCFVTCADHGANASTFAARVVISTGGSVFGAIAAALGAFGGHAHGGASIQVLEMIDQVQRPSAARAYVTDQLSHGRKIPGFGHRIYRTVDPRLPILRAIVERRCKDTERSRDFEVIEAIVDAMSSYADHGVCPNVDLYLGTALRVLGIPDHAVLPVFASARAAGWIAHIAEQHANNVLIRPTLAYSGAASRAMPNDNTRRRMLEALAGR